MNNTTNQQDLFGISRSLKPTRAEYTFVSSAHGIVTKIIKIFSNNKIKSEINNKNIFKIPNIWKLNNIL